MSADAAPQGAAARAPAEAVEPDIDTSIEQGGDPACWLGRVCDSCGALIEGSRGVPCWRCNTPWQPA